MQDSEYTSLYTPSENGSSNVKFSTSFRSQLQVATLGAQLQKELNSTDRGDMQDSRTRATPEQFAKLRDKAEEDAIQEYDYLHPDDATKT